jgi:hypothetical protein
MKCCRLQEVKTLEVLASVLQEILKHLATGGAAVKETVVI